MLPAPESPSDIRPRRGGHGPGGSFAPGLSTVLTRLPDVATLSRILAGMDHHSAELGDADVGFALSVPFKRFAELKQLIENRKRWRRINGQYSFFEHWWAPKSQGWCDRFVFVRNRSVQCSKGPVQLDLFQPTDICHDYQVVISNKESFGRQDHPILPWSRCPGRSVCRTQKPDSDGLRADPSRSRQPGVFLVGRSGP